MNDSKLRKFLRLKQFVYLIMLLAPGLTHAWVDPRRVHFEVSDLGTIAGGDVEAFDLSDSSEGLSEIATAVGTAFNLPARRYEAVFFPTPEVSALTTPPASVIVLPGLSGGIAAGISPNGLKIAGYREDSVRSQAFIYEGGRVVTLPTPTGWDSAAFDVNDSGMAVGASTQLRGEILYKHAFVYSPGSGAAVDLHSLFPTWEVSAAFRVNHFGHTVGYHDDQGFVQKGTYYEDLSYGDSSCFSKAKSLNENDMAVGFSDCASSFTDITRVALLWKWRADAVPHWMPFDLGSLGGAFRSAADINNNGWVVGKSSRLRRDGGGIHGFLWRNGHGLRDLNDITNLPDGYEIIDAVAVNGRNEVLATALVTPEPDAGAQMRAVLLRPIYELP